MVTETTRITPLVKWQLWLGLFFGGINEFSSLGDQERTVDSGWDSQACQNSRPIKLLKRPKGLPSMSSEEFWKMYDELREDRV